MPNYDLGTKRKKISPYLLIAAIAVLLVLIAYLLGLLSGGGGKISGRSCAAWSARMSLCLATVCCIMTTARCFACLQQAANCGACR